MSVYSKLLDIGLLKIEAQFGAIQKAEEANRPSVLHDVLAEGNRVLQPRMWDWILETTELPQRRDLISNITKMLAFDQGWDLLGGWE